MGKITRSEYDDAVTTIINYRKQLIDEVEEIDKNKVYHSTTKISDVEMSIRLYNCLWAMNCGQEAFNKPSDEITLSDLSKFTERDYLLRRNFGKRTITELRTIMMRGGVKLKNH